MKWVKAEIRQRKDGIKAQDLIKGAGHKLLK